MKKIWLYSNERHGQYFHVIFVLMYVSSLDASIWFGPLNWSDISVTIKHCSSQIIPQSEQWNHPEIPLKMENPMCYTQICLQSQCVLYCKNKTKCNRIAIIRLFPKQLKLVHTELSLLRYHGRGIFSPQRIFLSTNNFFTKNIFLCNEFFYQRRVFFSTRKIFLHKVYFCFSVVIGPSGSCTWKQVDIGVSASPVSRGSCGVTPPEKDVKESLPEGSPNKMDSDPGMNPSPPIATYMRQ